jgi:hypothetical protein
MIREFFEFRLVLSDFGGSRRKIAQRREGLADQYPDIHGTGNLRWGNREISSGTGNYQAARHAPRDLHVGRHGFHHGRRSRARNGSYRLHARSGSGWHDFDFRWP